MSSEKLREFVRQTLDEMVQDMSLEERLKGLSPADRLKGLSADEVVKAVEALPPEFREALARQLKANGSAPK